MSLRNKVIRLAHEKPELRKHLLPLVTKTATAGNDYPYKSASDIEYGLVDRGGASAFLIPLIFHFVGLPPVRSGWSEIKKRSDEAHSALNDFYRLIDKKMRRSWRMVQAITENPNTYVDGYKDQFNDWSGVNPEQWQKAFAKHLR